ncbi:MAG: hypothetical protein IKC65_05610 [Lentisphaeria bacterium]|nr:hypothetical protein [Lentisphaeria bacterium]
MSKKYFLAIDLGATSGRIMLGGKDLPLTELYRFETPVRHLPEGIHWDFEGIFAHILDGLKAIDTQKYPVCSISCDSWAQDFGLLDSRGVLTAPPFSYRDKGAAVSSRARLEYIEQKFPERLEKAFCLLHIADLVHFRLCGQMRSNYTLAAISGLAEDHPLLAAPADCEIIGRVDHPALGNLAGVPVISGAGHDTAAAYAGSGVQEGELLLSLGTWLMAAEPWQKEKELSENFRMLPLVRKGSARRCGGMGLWPFQECVKLWKKRGEFPGYAVLDAEAEKCGIKEWNDPGAPELFSPDDMEQAIFALAGRKCSPAEITALLLHGVAHRVRQTAAEFGHDFTRAVLVGGGSQCDYLCRLIARHLPCPLVTGPGEASAAGNIRIQQEVMGL